MSERKASDFYKVAVEDYTQHSQIIGRGSMGIAFGGMGEQVIKLHPFADEAYMAFIRWAKELTNEEYCKHFPRVYHYTDKSDHAVIVMERLYRYSDLPEVEQARIPSYLSPGDVGIYEAFEQAKHRFVYKLDEKLERTHIRHKRWSKFKVIDSLDDAMQALLLHVHTTGFACDLHDENILFRRMPDGSCEAVIIDPFAC